MLTQPLLDYLHPRSGFLFMPLNTLVDKDHVCITYSAYLHILLRRIRVVPQEPLVVATSLHARNGSV